ncbi:hypothetical protein BDN72DRAFT_831843 [Pluteus cervinus]|uniref:Uncharacterized protein n=1 Tax=Pluteus cervinus TaxID=181527 RepID=A0ACD3BBV6_9AGAR|nr:hypothetical protein BDN72DRAFT_831843 [Pluteus cervinus]
MLTCDRSRLGNNSDVLKLEQLQRVVDRYFDKESTCRAIIRTVCRREVKNILKSFIHRLTAKKVVQVAVVVRDHTPRCDGKQQISFEIDSDPKNLILRQDAHLGVEICWGTKDELSACKGEPWNLEQKGLKVRVYPKTPALYHRHQEDYEDVKSAPNGAVIIPISRFLPGISTTDSSPRRTSGGRKVEW